MTAHHGASPNALAAGLCNPVAAASAAPAIVIFVTVFTVGELFTMTALALVFRGGLTPLLKELAQARPALFWLFLGGFCWVVGDLFQQYAAKYIGIGRGIPLSNTNQLWGLAWGALVFGELSGKSGAAQGLILAGSATMIVGAVAISLAEAPASEQESWRASQRREEERYQLVAEPSKTSAQGEATERRAGRRWWDIPIVAIAAGIFFLLARGAHRPPMAINLLWTSLLAFAMLGFLFVCGWVLWKRTRFL